jgi:hypothetical protein
VSGPVRVLISSCLLGEKVRYDGGHKRDPFLVEILGRFVEYVPACPEVECGLPTPREAMRLVGNPADPHLVPLAVPVTLIGHYARKHDVACLKRQVFLNPHPVEWRLRNHV